MSDSRVLSRRPQYTEAELRTGSAELPGFECPGNIRTIFKDPLNGFDAWRSVLSMTLVSRLRGELHVLTGKRTAEGNTTHVNVASTPTMRLPRPFASVLLAHNDIPFCLDGKIDPLHPFVSESLYPSVASLPDAEDVLASPVGSLLALKLGLGEVMESAKQPIGSTSLARCVIGFSYLSDNDSEEPLYEPLVMLGAIVGLNEDIARQVPAVTSSYANLGWTPVGRYVHGVKTRSLLEVMPTASPTDEIEVCIRGLCNVTSSAIVSSPDEIQLHLTENGILKQI